MQLGPVDKAASFVRTHTLIYTYISLEFYYLYYENLTNSTLQIR